MDNCIFCRIIKGEIPSTKVFEDESVYAFRDINPMAKTHVLVVPKTHFADVKDLAGADPALLGKVFAAAVGIAEKEGIAESGFRLVTNAGEDGCQSVKHMHVHVLGGEKLSEKLA